MEKKEDFYKSAKYKKSVEEIIKMMRSDENRGVIVFCNEDDGVQFAASILSGDMLETLVHVFAGDRQFADIVRSALETADAFVEMKTADAIVEIKKEQNEK